METSDGCMTDPYGLSVAGGLGDSAWCGLSDTADKVCMYTGGRPGRNAIALMDSCCVVPQIYNHSAQHVKCSE